MTKFVAPTKTGFCPEPRDFFRHGNISKKSERFASTFRVCARHGVRLPGESPEAARQGGRLQQLDNGVIREVESEGSPRQSIGPTDRKPIWCMKRG